MSKEIVRRTFSLEIVEELNRSLPPLLSRIYAAREVKSISEIDHTLNKLHPFQAMLNVDKAGQILADAIAQQQEILIVGDFDADGATSTALAVRALRAFGAQRVQFLVPNRFEYGYGLTPELVSTAIQNGKPDLIVTVDNGIANHAGVLAAKSAGIIVIVTDHHLPAETLPPADVIVNPNQKACSFPSKHLAGVGVIFYVMLALRRILIDRDWFKHQQYNIPNMSYFLDLVALGTVADLVMLDQNNRILVEHGLKRIRAGQCVPAIVALLECAGRDFIKTKTSDLGFAVASRLNAAGRLDDMSLGITCLLSDDPIQARQIAQQLDQLNEERRAIEADMQTHAFQILDNIQQNFTTSLPRGLCLYDPEWHQGVIGILAARIKDKFHRPVVVFASGSDEELKGSVRSIPGLHIRDVLALINTRNPSLIKKFGGHAMAAGLTIAKAFLKDFTQIFNEVVSAQLTDSHLTQKIFTDGHLHLDELNLEVATMLRDAAPWGQAFAEPAFDDVFTIVEQRIVGDKHLKLLLAKDNKIIEGISFFVDTQQWPNHRIKSVHAVYKLDINEFRNKRNIQLIIEHLDHPGL